MAICPRCGKEYDDHERWVRVLKCASCDDSDYIMMREREEYCSPECRLKYNIIYKIKDKIRGRNGKQKI